MNKLLLSIQSGLKEIGTEMLNGKILKSSVQEFLVLAVIIIPIILFVM